MKKFIATILAFIYLGTSAGATIHLHYCMGKLADWTLWKNKSEKCVKCGMQKTDQKDGGCCKDEYKNLKLQTDQKVAGIFQLSALGQSPVPASQFEIAGVAVSSLAEKNPVSNAPPRSCDIAIHIRNCVFRI